MEKSKLSNADWATVRAKVAAGVATTQVANEYGITPKAIYMRRYYSKKKAAKLPRTKPRKTFKKQTPVFTDVPLQTTETYTSGNVIFVVVPQSQAQATLKELINANR